MKPTRGTIRLLKYYTCSVRSHYILKHNKYLLRRRDMILCSPDFILSLFLLQISRLQHILHVILSAYLCHKYQCYSLPLKVKGRKAVLQSVLTKCWCKCSWQATARYFKQQKIKIAQKNKWRSRSETWVEVCILRQRRRQTFSLQTTWTKHKIIFWKVLLTFFTFTICTYSTHTLN